MLQTLVIISTFLVLILSFALGIFTLFKNPKSKVSFLWFLTSMAVTIWAIGYIATLTADNPESGLLYTNVVYIGATMIPIFFFHFVAAFLYKDKKYKALIFLGYVAAAISLYFILATNAIVNGVDYLENFGYTETVSMTGFSMYLIYFSAFVLLSLFVLIKAYSENDGIRKRQIFYIFLAALIGFGGATQNFSYSFTGIYPYGQLLVWIYPLLVTYGIFIEEIKLKIKI